MPKESNFHNPKSQGTSNSNNSSPVITRDSAPSPKFVIPTPPPPAPVKKEK